MFIEDKVSYSEKTAASIPRLELMNRYRILATDLQVTFVKSELSAKSHYRSQILDRNNKTLDYEASQVKHLEEDYFHLL